MKKLSFTWMFLLCVLAGCGYGFGVRLPEGIDTLEVPIFENNTLVRGLEFELTSALTEELKRRTPVRLVSGDGDAKLSGAVVDYEKVPVYEKDGEIIAGRVKVKVVFKLAGSGSEKAIRQGTENETQDFDIRAGVLESQARRAAMREIARKIVCKIEAW